MLKKILTSPWTALLTLVVILGIRVADPAFVESVRLRYFDTLVTSKSAEVTGVHVVNIDERTLEHYGQFPFSRDRYADIIRDLYSRGAGLVVFNILTPDRDRMGRDTAYVAALEKYPTVLPSIGATQGRNKPRQPGSVTIGPHGLDPFVTYPGIIANIPTVESAAAGVGITNTLPEIDGVVRRMPMVVSVDGRLYPSLAMEVMRVAAGDSTFQVKINELGVEKMRIPAFGPVTTDSLSRIWIDWSLQPEQHSLMSLPATFNSEIVRVGVSAAGLANPVATSLGEMLPQDLQAAVISTLIANQNRIVISRPDWADGAEIIALVLLAVVLIFLSRWTYVGIVTSVVVLAVCIPISRLVYQSHSWLLDGTLVAGGLVIVLLHAYGIKFVSEFVQKQQIKRQFGSYVNPTIVERLQKDPGLIRLGGERKHLSVVMTDMRNFTALGESYGEAGVEDFTQVMNSYMTALSVPILNNDGTLIKFIGDASLHIHGAPLDDADHAYSAVKTAQEMIAAVEEFNKELAKLGKPPVGMGAGVNTGEILVGNIGAKTKFGYDVLGDPVSLAARLESQTKGYGVLIIISEATADLVRGRFPLWELDNIAVKGKTEPVRIFAIEETTDLHAEFLHSYYSGNWTQALNLINRCKHAAPHMEHYYDAMATRLETGVPDTWSGYYVATAK